MIDLSEAKKKFGEKLKVDVPFSTLTTLEIGGPASGYIEAETQEELIEILKFAGEKELPFFILGGGSNLLVSDEGLDKLVIKYTAADIIQEDKITVQAGTPLQYLVDFTIENGLFGVHKLNGIPGTIGGAVYGNAGAFGQTISDFIVSVVCFDGKEILELTKAACEFSYRDSGFKESELVILEVNFHFPKANPHVLREESELVLQKRLAKYKPGIKCPGSFFKNIFIEDLPPETKKMIPEDRDYYGKVPAWYFLDEVGAKGAKKGQVEITDFHGNLIMNNGGGTAQDFLDLAKEFADKVFEKFHIRLEPEVQLLNLPPLN